MNNRDGEKLVEITTRGNISNVKQWAEASDVGKLDLRLLPRTLTVDVGDLRIVSEGPMGMSARIFIDEFELKCSQDATLYLPIEGHVALDVRCIFRGKRK